MTRTALLRTLLLSSVSALLAPVSPLAANPGADAFLADFRISGDYVLEIGGKLAPKAEIYLSDRARAYLILTSELPSPVLVSPSARDVQSIDLMKVARRADGVIDILADAVLSPEGAFQLDGETIRFRAAGKSAVLKPRPWLLGAQTAAGMTDYNPEYLRREQDYVPDGKILARLRARTEPVRVLTFFGSWCPHCKKHVPMLMKVERELASAGWKFEYYGLPSPFTGEPEATKHNVRSVPTAIVFVGGKEVGRMPAAQWPKPEAGLEAVLTGGAAASGSR